MRPLDYQAASLVSELELQCRARREPVLRDAVPFDAPEDVRVRRDFARREPERGLLERYSVW